jgi:hypothetical protein
MWNSCGLSSAGASVYETDPARYPDIQSSCVRMHWFCIRRLRMWTRGVGVEEITSPLNHRASVF